MSWTGCGGSQSASFRSLVADAGATSVVVARFLALLELFREGAVAFDQVDAAGRADRPVDRATDERRGRASSDEFDEPAGRPAARHDGP